MSRFLVSVALLAALATVAVSTRKDFLRDQVSIPEIQVSKSENSTLTFPDSPSLPPVLRSLKLEPCHIRRRLFTATSPYLADPGTATLKNLSERITVLRIIFQSPVIRIRLAVRSGDSPDSLQLSGRVTHIFPRPFAMRLHRTKRTVSEAVAAIEAALAANPDGPRLVTVVDHASAASSVGLSLPDSSVVVFSNPAIGSQLWTRSPSIGIELPLEILIASSPLGVVYVAWNSASLLRVRFGLTALSPPVDDVLDTIDNALATLAGVAADLELTPASPRFDVARIPARDGVNTRRSKGDAVEAFSRLTDALEAAPPVNIAYQVAHDVAAMNAGLETGGTVNRVAVFGNPALGTLIMQRAFTAALDLPVKMGVWTTTQGASRYLVGYTSPNWIARRYRVEVPEMLSGALENFAAVAADA